MSEDRANEEVSRVFELIEELKNGGLSSQTTREIFRSLAKKIHLFKSYDVFDNIPSVSRETNFFGLLGHQCLLCGQWDASLHFLTQALLISPDDGAAAIQISRLLFFMKRGDDAKKISGMARANGSEEIGLESVISIANGNDFLTAGNLKAAEQNFRVAEASFVGWGYPFNKRLITLAKMQGVSRELSGSSTEPYITNIHLSSNGRFAHTLWEYFYMRFYAKQAKCILKTPDWFGPYLFETMDDPYQDTLIESYHGEENALLEVIKGNSLNAPVNVNLAENVCDEYSTFLRKEIFKYREQFSEMIKPRAFLKEAVQYFYDAIKAKGETLVVLHIRRTDMVGCYPDSFVAEETYVDWLKTFWDDLDDPILYIASDDIDAVLPAFKQFEAFSIKDTDEVPKGFEFYMDFHMLMHGEILGLAHSSFSRLGAFLNPVATRYGVPVKETGAIEEKTLKEVLDIKDT